MAIRAGPSMRVIKAVFLGAKTMFSFLEKTIDEIHGFVRNPLFLVEFLL